MMELTEAVAKLDERIQQLDQIRATFASLRDRATQECRETSEALDWARVAREVLAVMVAEESAAAAGTGG